MTSGLRKLGVAGFKYRGCEVTFFEALPLELQVAAEDDDEDAEEESNADRVKRLRKQMLDADIHGSA